MAWYTVFVLLALIAIVVYGADEAIKRLLGLSKFFRLSAFVTGVVIAGTLAVLMSGLSCDIANRKNSRN